MRKWNDTWERVAALAKSDPEYPLNDDLLKEILMKMYYNNYKGLLVKKESYENELNDRKLIKTIIHGDYTPTGVCYAVQGSPPKGSMFVFNPKYTHEIFYHERGKMRKLNARKYQEVSNLFFEDARNELDKQKDEK